MEILSATNKILLQKIKINFVRHKSEPYLLVYQLNFIHYLKRILFVIRILWTDGISMEKIHAPGSLGILKCTSH